MPNQNKEIEKLQQEVRELKLTLKQQFDHNFNISPIPSSSELRELESLLPGSTERILALAENQLQRNHEQNMALIEAEKQTQLMVHEDNQNTWSARKRAQWFSFVFVAMGFSYAVWAGSNDRMIEAIVAILGGITPVVIALLTSHKK